MEATTILAFELAPSEFFKRIAGKFRSRRSRGWDRQIRGGLFDLRTRFS